MNIVQYEDAQARLEEEMRRAAVWRMQRQARDARSASKNKSAQSGWQNGWQSAWLKNIGKAFSAVRSTNDKSAAVATKSAAVAAKSAAGN